MSAEQCRSSKGRWRLVALLAVMAVAGMGAVAASDRLSPRARAILASGVCGLGVLVAAAMLVILVRQYQQACAQPEETACELLVEDLL